MYNFPIMEQFSKDVQALTGLRLTPKQLAAFALYQQELLTWNEQFNLTAIRDEQGIRTKHFLDSLSCLLALREPAPARLMDIGSGAGFPGIPLKIALPNLHLILVESVGKKVTFLKHIVEKLALDRVDILLARVEDVGQNPIYREKQDWVVARAVANLPTLAEYLLPLARMGGAVLAQKGESAPAEAHAAERPIKLLGGHLRRLEKITLPGVADERYLVVIEKIAATPPQYPRRVGVPLKNPLK